MFAIIVGVALLLRGIGLFILALSGAIRSLRFTERQSVDSPAAPVAVTE